MTIKFNVEYEITPIRFVTVYCPDCNHEFDAREHGKGENDEHIHDSVDLKFAIFTCPSCNHTFKTRGVEIEINEQ